MQKALIGINLSMVHMIAVDYGYQYAQNIINRAADVLVSTALNGVCFFTRVKIALSFISLITKTERNLLHLATDYSSIKYRLCNRQNRRRDRDFGN